ncbi:hypothetical protein BGX31_008693 [Mortierella sp. GBA43]|nr:hypothetical protein BGX31_008693 [Mortierella sp. GBA43]
MGPGGAGAVGQNGDNDSYTDIFRPIAHDSAAQRNTSSVSSPATQQQQYQYNQEQYDGQQYDMQHFDQQQHYGQYDQYQQQYDQQQYDQQQYDQQQYDQQQYDQQQYDQQYGQYYGQQYDPEHQFGAGHEPEEPDRLSHNIPGHHLSFGSQDFGSQNGHFLHELRE